jgi:hypothetical protein
LDMNSGDTILILQFPATRYGVRKGTGFSR